MKQITKQELDEVLEWVNQFSLSKPKKSRSRDFSDGVLLAEILKELYPKFVELHNYPPRNSVTLKMDNWRTLNRKILKRIDLHQTDETLNQLCKAVPGIIETLLFDLMIKYRCDKKQNDELNDSSSDQNTNENCEIMMVNIEKRYQDDVEFIQQKMILYSLYEQSEKTCEEQKQTIAILEQKIGNLDNMLKLKSKRIEDLSYRLANKKSNYSIMNHELSEEKCFYETS